ncbi:hypothetical protein ACLOJK_022814, partial [Asimina triloba]
MAGNSGQPHRPAAASMADPRPTMAVTTATSRATGDSSSVDGVHGTQHSLQQASAHLSNPYQRVRLQASTDQRRISSSTIQPWSSNATSRKATPFHHSVAIQPSIVRLLKPGSSGRNKQSQHLIT